MIVSADLLAPLPTQIDRTDAERRARYCVKLLLAYEICTIYFEDLEASRIFARRYADLICIGDGRARHEAFAVHDPVHGHLFWARGSTVYRWPKGDLPSNAIAFLIDAVALSAFVERRRDGLVSLHAAVAAVSGGAAAIVGDSHTGKTTTAVACSRIGMQLYSDERCLIDRRGNVHAFPRAINIRGSGLRLLTQDVLHHDDRVGAQLRARPDGAWDDVPFATLCGNTIRKPRPLRAAFLITGVAAQPSLKSTTPAAAAKAVARWAYGAGHGIDKISRLLQIFRAVDCYSLVLGGPDASARAIRERLEAACLQTSA